MDLLSIREIYRNKDQYLNKEVEIGGCLFSQRFQDIWFYCSE